MTHPFRITLYIIVNRGKPNFRFTKMQICDQGRKERCYDWSKVTVSVSNLDRIQFWKFLKLLDESKIDFSSDGNRGYKHKIKFNFFFRKDILKAII